MDVAELDYQGGVEDGGYFGEGADGEVLVAGLMREITGWVVPTALASWPWVRRAFAL